MENEVKEEELKTEEVISDASKTEQDVNEQGKNTTNTEEPKASHESKKEKKHKINKEKDELIKANLELKEKVLRITAEMQNMRRRYDNDLSNAHKYEGFELIKELLPIIDNFERALNTKIEGADKFLDGFKMIYTSLTDILKSHGITEIEAEGKPFDPNIMNAVMTESDESKESNTVLSVLQKGYMYHDRILRPVMVKVNE